MENPTKRNPIFNSNVLDTNDECGKNGAARYTSTNVPLIDHVEKSANMKYAQARNSLDLWLKCVCLALDQEREVPEKAWLPKYGGLVLITEKDCPPRRG